MQIGEVAKLTGINISTLRYYDKQGLLQNIERTSGGTRKFSDTDINTLKVIDCLKNSGMQLKDIKIFMDWCHEGDSTIDKRLEMFKKQEEAIEKELATLNKALDLIKFKKWYYTKAKEDGTESIVKKMNTKDYPPKIQELYKNTH